MTLSLTGFGYLDEMPKDATASPLPRPSLPRPILSYQPLKTIYLILYVLDLTLRKVPFWILKYSIPHLRPCKHWSLPRSLVFSILKSNFDVFPRARISSGARDHTLLDPIVIQEHDQESGSLKNVQERALWVEPVGAHYIKGQIDRWVKDTESSVERIPGYWIGKGRFQQIVRASENEKVIFFLHGGGLVSRSGHPSDPTSNAVKKTLKACQEISGDSTVLPQRAFSLEYRLASRTSFPGILLDALAGYVYLVKECGFEPKNITVMGDSAGGLLAVALARYLRDEKVEKMMGGLVLLSPWLDLSLSYSATLNASFVTNKETDYLTDRACLSGAQQVLLGMPRDSFFHEYLSPTTLGRSIEQDLFADFPRALFFAGGLERARDQIRDAVRYYRVGNKDVTYFEEQYATHDWMCLPFNGTETQRTAKRIAEWIK